MAKEDVTLDFRLKNRRNMTLSFRRNKTKWVNEWAGL